PHVRALPMAGQTAGSMQWVGQIQSANETYRERSGPVRSYGVPGSRGTGATSIARPGHRSRARATSHRTIRGRMNGVRTNYDGPSPAGAGAAPPAHTRHQ